MRKKRIVLSAGGTGGHLFPAQSLAESLVDWEVLFVAGGLAQNSYFHQDCFAFESINCSTFSFSKPLAVLKGMPPIYRGIKQSQKILQKFSHDCVVGFGSFLTLPVLVATLLKKIPLILHEQNTIPGKVNKLFSRFAHTTAITFPQTKKHLKGNLVEVKFPIRASLPTTERQCWDYFQMQPDKKTILVFGGSQGAEKLNALLLEALKEVKDVQVLHFTGDQKRAQQARQFYHKHTIKACVKAFEPHMDRAMKIADIAVTRAGAGTVCELIEHELPAVVIPFPYATEGHQQTNGEHFTEYVKGGQMLFEASLAPECLKKNILDLFQNLSATKKQIQDYKQTRDQLHLSQLIRNILQ